MTQSIALAFQALTTEAEMTLTVWLIIPVCAAIFLAVAGIPLWLVLRRPEWGSACGWTSDTATAPNVPAQTRPVAPVGGLDRRPASSRIEAAPAGPQSPRGPRVRSASVLEKGLTVRSQAKTSTEPGVGQPLGPPVVTSPHGSARK